MSAQQRGLSRSLRADSEMTALLTVAAERKFGGILSAITLAEADHGGVHEARMPWALSRLVVERVTKKTAARAVKTLRNTDELAGHIRYRRCRGSYGLAAQKPVVVLNSNPEDLAMLCGDRVRIIKVWLR